MLSTPALPPDLYGGCVYYGAPAVEFDHVTPTSRGGSNLPSNRVPCCKACNSAKGDKTLDEFRSMRARQAGTESYLFFYEFFAQPKEASHVDA